MLSAGAEPYTPGSEYQFSEHLCVYFVPENQNENNSFKGSSKNKLPFLFSQNKQTVNEKIIYNANLQNIDKLSSDMV